ncbi:zymogen granule membrane protein 16-like [Alosa sapidissima]|uniref:zymogen granule membrane protein 16-like n=1 Tax=Alosa sapidissima TaxID=34773 RepID=UPI001C091ED8|nr:zymogen granule membrane protein 16-like [Alosa sapidissima]
MPSLLPWMVLCVLGVTSLTQADQYSFSSVVGRASGLQYATEGDGHITSIRVWDAYGYIAGFQLRYAITWGPVYGRRIGQATELELTEGEGIVQLSGKYNYRNYIWQLMFVTSRGRSLVAGQPSGSSFNFYPTNSSSELLILSGRVNRYGITAIGAHWGWST